MIEVVIGYFFGTLLRGLLIVSGLAVLERLGGLELWHTRWRSMVCYCLLLFLLLPVGGVDYSGFTWYSAAPVASGEVTAPVIGPEKSKQANADGFAFPAATATATAAAPASELKMKEFTPVTAPELTPVATYPEWTESAIAVWHDGPLQPILFGLWCMAGIVVATIQLLRQHKWGRRVGALPELHHIRLKRIFRQMEVRAGFAAGKVKLYDCQGVVDMPCCCGIWRPVVLFPVALAKGRCDAELEMLFLHELLHLKRRNTLLLELESVLGMVFFFNPFLKYLFRRLNRAEELACDQAVIERLEGAPGKNLTYGRLLLLLASGNPGGARPPALAPGLTGGKGELKLRLQLITTSQERKRTMKKTLVMFGVVALLGAGCMLLPSCKAEQEAATPETAKIPAGALVEDSFSFSFTDPADGEAQTYVVQYLTRVDANGKLVPGTENVVCYVPWLGETAPFSDPDNRYYAEKLGYTVFAIPDPIYPPLGVFLAAHEELARRLGLEPRKMLLYGASSGATNALNASIEFPDRVDAIAAHSPRRWYDANTSCTPQPNSPSGFKKADQVGRLISRNWYDSAREGVEQIIDDVRAQKMTPLAVQTPPNPANVDNAFYHRAPGPFSQELFHRYFADIVALRDANNGVLPLASEWPVIVETASGSLRFPGKLSAEYCRNLPHDAAAKIGQNGDLPASSVQIPATSGQPTAAAVILAGADFPNQMHLLNYAWQLADQANADTFAAVATLDAKVDTALFQQMLQAARATDLPVYVIALGQAAETVLAQLPENADGRIKKVSTVGIPWDAKLVAGDIPVVMYFDQTTASTPSPASKITGINLKAPAGFGAQLPEVLNAAVTPILPEVKDTGATREVNNLPELLEQAAKLEAAIPAQGGTTEAQAYIDAVQTIRQRAAELKHIGLLEPEKYFYLELELLEIQTKYWMRTLAGKTADEASASLLGLQKQFSAVLENYAQYLQMKTNAGGSPEQDRKDFERFYKRYEEAFAAFIKTANTNPTGDTVKKQRNLARARGAVDRKRYTPEQFNDIEQKYQQAARSLRKPESQALLRQIIAEYPDSNRAGCAMMYLAQVTTGDEQLECLRNAIDKYSDCFYYDGNQVGAQARYYLAMRHLEAGEKEKAEELFTQILTLYPEAINHNGKLFVALIAEQMTK